MRSLRGQPTPVPHGEAEQEAVHELAARLAHQLGNLLQVVNGNLELIALHTNDERVLRYLDNARAAAEQLTALTRTLPIDPPD